MNRPSFDLSVQERVRFVAHLLHPLPPPLVLQLLLFVDFLEEIRVGYRSLSGIGVDIEVDLVVGEGLLRALLIRDELLIFIR